MVRYSKGFGISAALLAAASVIWISYSFAYTNTLDRLSSEGRGRLEVYASGLRNVIRRFDYLPAVLRLDQDLLELMRSRAAGSLQAEINIKLKAIGSEANADQLYLLDAAGITKAASNFDTDLSFVGRDYSFRPYFTEALRYGRYGFFGVGVTTGEPGYFLGAAIPDHLNPAGVVVVKVSLEQLEVDWLKAQDRVALADGNGIVILTSIPGWKYRPLTPLSRPVHAELVALRQFGNSMLQPITDLGRGSLSNRATSTVGLDGGEYALVHIDLPEFGWTLYHLVDVGQARQRGILMAALTTVFSVAALALLAAVRQRTLRLRSEREHQRLLEVRINERTAELRLSNMRLVEEIALRAQANADLVAAQEESIQAGKLSALGQMAAAIVHEVNQPIAAIRTFAKSGIFLLKKHQYKGPGPVEDVFSNIDILAQKMAIITADLRSFARKTPAGRKEPVNIAVTVDTALALLAKRMETDEVRATTDIDPHAHVLASPIRLQQVLVNLIGNALDAMDEVEDRKLRISAERVGDMWRISVSDSGTGFSSVAMDSLFEPFFTTKVSGKGLGLGLALSLRIIKDFGGALDVENNSDAGATLVVSLPAERAAERSYG